jgi:hypothetical protein
MNAVSSRNIKFLSHSDQGGRGDGVQVMVNRGHAYIGHGFSNGITVIDVRDAKNPKTVNFLACPPNTRAHHIQTHGDLLLAVNGPSVWTMQVSQEAYFAGTSGDALKGQQFTSGLRVYDLSKPEAPREFAFLPLGGLGPHRIWYVGERYAYVSVHLPEFSDHILVIVDMKEPTKPEVVGKFWLPGMWTGGGETPTWPKGRRYALHHGLVAGNLAYTAWRDGGLAIVDVGDPAKPKLVCHRNWDPPFGGGTHSPLPLPDRNLLVVADEANFANCSLGLRYIWMFDVRVPAHRVPKLALHLRDPAQCRRARLRHRQSVPAARGRFFRAAAARAHVRSAAEPAAGDPVVRLLRRCRGADVRHRFQRRLVHLAIRRRAGVTRCRCRRIHIDSGSLPHHSTPFRAA